MNSIYTEALQRLSTVYEPGEAHAVVRAWLEDAFGITLNDIYAGKDIHFSEEERQRFRSMLARLAAGEPVQYVTGIAPFGDIVLEVGPGVLVPRPETLELAQWAAEQCPPGARILDIGTGSGCLAVWLALHVSNAHVTAVDISREAIAIAQRNAANLGARISFVLGDALHNGGIPAAEYDLIVSNPPYVCLSERSAMHRNVLAYEPHEALFVDDSDPLLFYRAIARYAAAMLAPHGATMVEINRHFARETADTFRLAGFTAVETCCDMQGNPRMICARQ